MNIDDIRMAKVVLEDGGVKVYQKDIQDVKVHHFNMRSEDGEMFPHRVIYRIEMNDGKVYEAVKETIDKNGNFSLGSGLYATTEIRTELENMPYDHVFPVDGNDELCHATGYEVKFYGEDIWWNEYEDSNGELHYGR